MIPKTVDQKAEDYVNNMWDYYCETIDLRSFIKRAYTEGWKACKESSKDSLDKEEG